MLICIFFVPVEIKGWGYELQLFFHRKSWVNVKAISFITVY